jgi:hypothetical protein
LETHLVPDVERLLALHVAELPQKDELCGPFWGTLALRLFGHTATPSGEAIDQDAVALEAGTVLSPPPRLDSLPPGEPGRSDYRLDLPTDASAAASGSSVAGVARAVHALSDGAIEAIPVAGPWDREAVLTVMSIAVAEPTVCLIMANVSTVLLWGSRPSPPQIVAYLHTGDASGGPPPDWDVGHFVALLGVVTGKRGTLVVTADTYGSLGWDGVHLQPVEQVSSSLHRGGTNAGGIIVFVGADRSSSVAAELKKARFVMEMWDNGSVDRRGS